MCRSSEAPHLVTRITTHKDSGYALDIVSATPPTWAVCTQYHEDKRHIKCIGRIATCLIQVFLKTLHGGVQDQSTTRTKSTSTPDHGKETCHSKKLSGPMHGKQQEHCQTISKSTSPKAENNRHKLHMSQRKAFGDDANRWMMRRRPCPAALDGDREQRSSWSAVASRVGTQVPLNQSLGKPAWCARRRWSVCTQAA